MNNKQLILDSFNFIYAGQVSIGITTIRNKFRVYSNGLHIYNDITTFMPDYKVRFDFDTLYEAINQFNYLVRKCTESMDWYKEDHFTDEFYKRELK